MSMNNRYVRIQSDDQLIREVINTYGKAQDSKENKEISMRAEAAGSSGLFVPALGLYCFLSKGE